MQTISALKGDISKGHSENLVLKSKNEGFQ